VREGGGGVRVGVASVGWLGGHGGGGLERGEEERERVMVLDRVFQR
jgi:hypothetical protein